MRCSYLYYLISIFTFINRLYASDGVVLDFRATTPQANTVISSLQDVERLIDRARKHGIGHFTIPILMCQTTTKSETLHWCNQTSEENYLKIIEQLTNAIHTRGGTVGYMAFNKLERGGVWRGIFNPRNRARWVENSERLFLPVLQLARRLNVREVAIGSELNVLFRETTAWRAYLQRAKRFLGERTHVFVVLGWDAITNHPLFQYSDYIAISAYYPLTQATQPTDANHTPPTIDAMVAGWQQWKDQLIQLSRSINRPLYLYEIGYPSHSMGASRPWEWDGPIDLNLQQNLFIAFKRVWLEPRVRELGYFQIWNWEANTSHNNPRHSPVGKPAESQMRALFQNNTRPE